MSSLSFGRHKVSTSRQAIVSRPDVPRSTFATSATHKTTFDADFLIPIYTEEILPGDSLSLDVTAFIRTATPLFPIMDNLYADIFFFFVPNRLVWEYNWTRFMGERTNPDSSIDFLVPQIVFPRDSEVPSLSIYDYMGIPPITIADVEGAELAINALPIRAYDRIWDEWFRDQNLQDVTDGSWGDGPDEPEWYSLRKRGKRHDYFTSALTRPQKGNPVSLPLSGQAPIISTGMGTVMYTTDVGTTGQMAVSSGGLTVPGVANGPAYFDSVGLEVDLTDVAAVTINTLRSAVAVQQLLERDARVGTRYTEILQGHFGVFPQDSRLQRPEYLGGSSNPINFTPVAQTSGTGASGTTSPLAALGAAGTAVPKCRISHSFPEHGHVIGLLNVRADLTYQQGIHRMWTRRTRYDYAWPAFARLGEQVVRQDEIYVTDDPDANATVFGYQERYAEYRYRQSMVSGRFRSGISGTMDAWHLSQYFDDAPTLDDEGVFISSTTPMERVLAAGSLAEGQQFFGDILFRQRFTRPLPLRGDPGLSRL